MGSLEEYYIWEKAFFVALAETLRGPVSSAAVSTAEQLADDVLALCVARRAEIPMWMEVAE